MLYFGLVSAGIAVEDRYDVRCSSVMKRSRPDRIGPCEPSRALNESVAVASAVLVVVVETVSGTLAVNVVVVVVVEVAAEESRVQSSGV